MKCRWWKIFNFYNLILRQLMIRLKPVLEIPAQQCPNCASTLAATDFIITGMRNLADSRCADCGGEFYGDLPAGQALYTPITLDKKTGATHGGDNAKWFADWLAESYENRSREKIGFETRKFSPPKDKVILLNCLDVLYGHSLLKLLNAQYYLDHQPDFSLILIVQPFLEWLIPDGIAEAWIVDLPLRRGTEWNERLADEIKNRLAEFREIYLSVAFSHPHSADFDIERFTRVAPFPLENFGKFQKNPVVTFIRREDRLWESENETAANNFQKIKRRFAVVENNLNEQTRRIIEFAERLREKFPQVDFAVAGLGNTNVFPDWIKDLRLTKLDEKAERAWCERYAKSHLVVGVHGSNMLLPSAHAGCVIELLEENRQGNFLQDILFRGADAREMFFRYRFAPLSTSPENLAKLAGIVLKYENFRRLMSPEFCRHRDNYTFEDYLMK